MRVKRIQVVCVVGSLVLYTALKLAGGEDGDLSGGKYLPRNSHGEGESSYEVLVEGLEAEEIPMEITVGERLYSNQEADSIFEDIMRQMDSLILGENKGISEITENMNLITEMPEYGVRIRWMSEKPEVLDSFGTVYNENLTEKGEVVRLEAELSDGEHKASYEVGIKVYPPLLTEKEEAVQKFSKRLKLLDEAQQQSEHLSLPMEYEGKTLHYREKNSSGYEILLVLGVLLAVLCGAKDQVDLRKKEKIRHRQLMLDYSELVSKLMVFIGAGMTIRIAWEKIAFDYDKMKKSGKRSERYVYEEMCKTCYQLQSGTSEGQAYNSFGKRCQLQPYLKLASLLEQNRREGTKNLRNLLTLEMIGAFEQRKNLARKMGEEAGTKLLLPLFLMLLVVMVMIMVPALLSFY